MKKIEGFWEAWRFLEGHRMFRKDDESVLMYCLKVDVVKVNPETGKVEEDSAKNTETKVFLGCRTWYRADDTGLGEPLAVHVPELDCAAKTFEEAIVTLANLVYMRSVP